jgi:hypothetical protein
VRTIQHQGFITLMMEAVRTSETSVYSNENTWRYIPEGFNHHTGRRENLKSYELLPSSPVFPLRLA